LSSAAIWYNYQQSQYGVTVIISSSSNIV